MHDLYLLLAETVAEASNAEDDRPQPPTRFTASVETVDADCVGIHVESVTL